jgi:hypothetical protein
MQDVLKTTDKRPWVTEGSSSRPAPGRAFRRPLGRPQRAVSGCGSQLYPPGAKPL